MTKTATSPAPRIMITDLYPELGRIIGAEADINAPELFALCQRLYNSTHRAVFQPYRLAFKGGLDVESYTAIECCLWSVAVVEKSDRSGISDKKCIVKLVVYVLCHGIGMCIGRYVGRCYIAL